MRGPRHRRPALAVRPPRLREPRAGVGGPGRAAHGRDVGVGVRGAAGAVAAGAQVDCIISDPRRARRREPRVLLLRVLRADQHPVVP